MTEPRDLLTDKGSISGVLLLNFGDPAFDAVSRPEGSLPRSESIFIRIIAYLLFAEAVSIPTRYMLDGPDMAQAISWSGRLLEEGILIPERRSGPKSFDELARLRKLPEIGLHRAEFLDRHVSRVRTFQHTDLSETYVKLLTHDLDHGGAFRQVVRGAKKNGLNARLLDKALPDFIQNTDGTPEAFARSVANASPALRNEAGRWAAARYYTTPLLYDEANTREVPLLAAKLLARGRAIDLSVDRFSGAAPADETHQRLEQLHTQLPAGSIAQYHEQYCEALLEVRRSSPEARKIFSDIREAEQLHAAGETLSRRFAAELDRQKRVREDSGRTFSLVSSLAGGGVGFGSGLLVAASAALPQLGVALAAAATTGAAGNELQVKLKKRKQSKRQPWLLAMDNLEAKIPRANPPRR